MARYSPSKHTLDSLTEHELIAMKNRKDNYETALVLTDEHIPFINEEMVKIAEAYLRDEKPKYRIHLGDLIDNPGMSQFDSDPNYKRNTQDEIDEAVRYLNRLYEASPETQVVLLPGNHDVMRISRQKSFNANGMGSLRALDYQHLILESAQAQGLEIGNIEIVSKPIRGTYTIGGEKGMMFVHGDSRMDARVRSGVTGLRNTAETHPFRGHIVMGHGHQIKEARARHHDRSVWMVGAMMDVDALEYNHQSLYENGLMVVHFNTQVRPRPTFHVQNLRLEKNGTMLIDGKEYRGR